MKKTQASDSEASAPDDMLPEYRFDYRKAKPNRFAEAARNRGETTVVLDDDVAAVFTNSEAVNRALRALIDVVPPRAR